MIGYNIETASPRPVDTMATYICDTGYTLNGETTRTCGSDGVWSGSTPVCQRKWKIAFRFSCCVWIPIQRNFVLTSLSPMETLSTVLDPLATDLSSLQLYTAAILATLSLEGVPGWYV